MAGEPTITVVGNLTSDPELRFTPGGKAVASFTVAQTPRTKVGDQWQDGEATFWRCSVWDKAAENVAESLTKGTRVLVHGRVSTRTYTKSDGTNGSSLDLQVDAIGPELRWSTCKVNRDGAVSDRTKAPVQNDPWATPAAAADPWATPATSDAPPF